MNLHHAARALGGEVNGPGRILCPGPGHSPSDRSLSVRFDGGDFTVHSFAGDDWRACKDYVRERLGFQKWEPGDGRDRRISSDRVRDWDRGAVDDEAGGRARSEDDLIRIRRARELWEEAGDPRGTLAETYLRSRCLDLDERLAGNVLRYLARCPWRDENTGCTIFVPAMVAAFRSIDDDEVTAVHRIALTDNGSKIGRRMLGVVHRAAVKLDPAGGELAIGEGVETCMATRQLGIGVPTWALGSVGAINFFPLLDGVSKLHLIGEAGDASRQAVEICGTRWKREGRRVFLRKPRDGHSDFNDVLMAGMRR